MNTYELLKSLVGCTITEKENGVIEIAPSEKNDISETIKDSDVPELIKFKEGDFLYFANDLIFIYKGCDGRSIIAYCFIYKYKDFKSYATTAISHVSCVEKCRRATEEEKQMLLDALHDDRKIWNPDTKQIEEDRAPRVGDKCVFWDEDNARNLTVGKLHMLLEHGEKYCTENFGAFECCVRFQDFDFETMKPKY